MKCPKCNGELTYREPSTFYLNAPLKVASVQVFDCSCGCRVTAQYGKIIRAKINGKWVTF